ncbi:ribokinase [Tengunoibacter tsumagoiensis]|uniref:Ribokinase n=1 Tax=Tengunoibacter tsumagoiensis TaxID=2014871 RepID=A0A402A6I1_9CHLR|nr:ribokinase [Tengunoibacter tsumagoiensis]GCE14636.1 ribokinase [Tengunoibacter tsumagoiensis]
MKKICVIGSFNIDIITTTDRMPKLGETVFSNTFDVFVGGGKGGNQAVALGKLDADVRMVGKLGDRFYGPDYLEVLKKHQVQCDTVEIEPGMFPGTAVVAVDRNGDNLLFVYSGANQKVDTAFIDRHWEAISACDIFLFQLEIPLETNLYALKKLKELHKTVILDPAPATDYHEDMLQYTDYVTPNETELELLTGVAASSFEDFQMASRLLIEKGARTVIAKAGKNGAYLFNAEMSLHLEGYHVNAVDTTAAGDSFNAGFAYALAEGKNEVESIRFANAVAALSTTVIGAQNGMPTLQQVQAFLSQQHL